MHYKFHKAYIELTNICGLKCEFCPTKTIQTNTMDLEFFEKILKQLQPYTSNIALHVFGDPLTLSNLEQYLDISLKYNFKVHITTTGYYLDKFDLNIFLHKAIKQINFSLNSYNKNEMKLSLDEYLKPMFQLCDLKLLQKRHFFINFRLWNLDTKNSENKFNTKVLQLLSKKFQINFSTLNSQNNQRLDNKILLNYDNYFQWPNLQESKISHGYCHGLSSQIAILSNGTVVPCCLDSFGNINLGNLNTQSLEKILHQKKSLEIVKGFKNEIAVEELCQKCTFKDRFN